MVRILTTKPPVLHEVMADLQRRFVFFMSNMLIHDEKQTDNFIFSQMTSGHTAAQACQYVPVKNLHASEKVGSSDFQSSFLPGVLISFPVKNHFLL